MSTLPGFSSLRADVGVGVGAGDDAVAGAGNGNGNGSVVAVVGNSSAVADRSSVVDGFGVGGAVAGVAYTSVVAGGGSAVAGVGAGDAVAGVGSSSVGADAGTGSAVAAGGSTGVDGAAAAATALTAPLLRRVTVWDLPLRLFHWALAIAVPAAIATGLAGGAWMRVHGIVGLFIVGLLAFRLIWGFAGSRHARFAEFLPTPRAVLAYVRGRWRGVGHNPLGALAVFAMLVLLIAQVVSGLLSNDDIAYAGPWAAVLADETVARVTGWHRWFANWLYGVLALHVVAIGWYSVVRRAGLVSSMVSGAKQVGVDDVVVPAGRDDLRGSEYFAVAALFFAVLVVYLAAGAVLPFAEVAAPEAPGW